MIVIFLRMMNNRKTGLKPDPTIMRLEDAISVTACTERSGACG